MHPCKSAPSRRIPSTLPPCTDSLAYLRDAAVTLAALASCHAPAAAALLSSRSSLEATTPDDAPTAAPALMAALAALHDHALPQVCDVGGGR